MLRSARFRTAFATVSLFTVLAGDAWRYTLSWWGFGVIAVLITVAAAALLYVERDRWTLGGMPYPLVVFLALATVSIAWSAYPGDSAIGVVTTWMTVTTGAALAVAFTWRQLLRSLGHALRAILGLSIVFELVVAWFIQRPVLPLWVDYPEGELPKLLYWSRNALFDDGKIQGIVGNSSVLAMIALLGLIVFSLQLALRTFSRLWSWVWIVVAAGVVVLTRSATIAIALVVLGAVLIVVWRMRRARTPRRRTAVYAVATGAFALALTGAIVFREQLLEALGKDTDLTGRLEIWDAVWGLIVERPWFGWGWVSYWTPWSEPLGTLVKQADVWQLHAHNAWLDVWMQLGIVGLIVFVGFAGAALVKAWQHAVDRPQFEPDHPERFTAITLLPLLLMVALLVQSLAESRLLVEYGLVLLTIVAIKTKRRELV